MFSRIEQWKAKKKSGMEKSVDKIFEFSNQLSEVDISDVKGGCKNMSKGDAEKQDADLMMNTDNEIEHQEGTNHPGHQGNGGTDCREAAAGRVVCGEDSPSSRP